MAAGENIAADFGDGSGDAVLRAAFAGVNLKPQLAHLFGNQLPVESLAGMFLVNIGDGGAVNRRVSPHRKLGIAMLAKNKGVDALRADIQRLGQYPA